MNRRQFVSLGAIAVAASQGIRPAFADQATFKIGALAPVTGAGAAYGAGMLKAAQMAVAEVNAAGGAGGANLEIVAEDSQTSPQAAVLGAKKMLEVSQVRAIVACWSSGESLAVIPLTNEANVILMHTSGAPALSLPPANAKKLGFRFQATNDRFGRAFAQIAKKQNYKVPATMAFNNASGIGNTQGFTKAWLAMGGQVAASVVYEPNRPSYRSELQQVLRAKPDVIVTGSYLADTTIILREWYQTGQNTHWIVPGWALDSNMLKALGPDVTNGIISVESISNEGGVAYKHFISAYAKATGQPATDNVYAAMAYDEVVILALAVQALGAKATTAQIAAKVHEIGTSGGKEVNSFTEGKAALASGGRISYIGASSRINFDENNDVTPDFSASFAENGKLVRKYIVSI
jgi:branched-chain amino acid transport system substrate-binding protein